MKKTTELIALLLSIFSSISCSAQDQKTVSASAINKVEVLYFHYTRRCVTCNTVESETKKSLESLYPEQMKSGAISFRSINLDDDSSKVDADRAQAAGQSLLIMSGSSRTDLTNKAFMYAVNSPEKLKSTIQKTLDPLLNIK